MMVCMVMFTSLCAGHGLQLSATGKTQCVLFKVRLVITFACSSDKERYKGLWRYRQCCILNQILVIGSGQCMKL